MTPYSLNPLLSLDSLYKSALTVDQARWHMSEKLEVPEGIHLFPLPPYSPELQPAERLWPVVNQALGNIVFDSIEPLEDLVEQRWRYLLNSLRVDPLHQLLSLVA
ncbi:MULTISPECIES: transposase [unclassified Moorena]|uniref:transposase n=1 Tax=unclassified Moorena TaxID=2683338 RepID=UPI0025FCCD0C|nr:MULTISPECIES: transposase [unclassified Moorena]